MSLRPDNRLLDAPMQPVTCDTCQGQVEVRKSSWEQTSIQWHDDAVERCVERRAASPRPGPNGATFQGCEALRRTVATLAVGGDLDVQSEESDA
ncbi:MAG: ferredoxin [Nocardioides sp.]|nr:ferredoxin [Nocardioides sp.]